VDHKVGQFQSCQPRPAIKEMGRKTFRGVCKDGWKAVFGNRTAGSHKDAESKGSRKTSITLVKRVARTPRSETGEAKKKKKNKTNRKKNPEKKKGSNEM